MTSGRASVGKVLAPWNRAIGRALFEPLDAARHKAVAQRRAAAAASKETELHA